MVDPRLHSQKNITNSLCPNQMQQEELKILFRRGISPQRRVLLGGTESDGGKCAALPCSMTRGGESSVSDTWDLFEVTCSTEIIFVNHWINTQMRSGGQRLWVMLLSSYETLLQPLVSTSYFCRNIHGHWPWSIHCGTSSMALLLISRTWDLGA